MGVLNSSGGMLLHASSVVIAEKGFVFMGDEGAGKSTIRTLLSQYMSLGDDTAIIRKRGNKIYLYGSPLYQRTKMAYPNKKVLVAGIFSLVQAPFNLIQTLDLPSQLRQLSNNVWLSGLDGFQNEKQALARTLLSFSNFQRVFTLYFKKTPEIGTLLLAFSQHSWHAKIPRRIFSKANIDLRRSLEKDALWSEGIADGSFLEQCLVINERSWDFEFGQERNFLEIAKKILASPEDAYHRSFVHSKKKLLRQGKEKPVVIVIKHGDSHVILDGNHSALAWHSMGDRAKQAGITVFVGTIIPEKENETILKSYL